ncbi:MAG TPA: glycosyl hydrolase 115 family protein, partial [Opitutus sp.]|nr:glycosyl hydrolase 115 family protein [Opitutus sp.]
MCAFTLILSLPRAVHPAFRIRQLATAVLGLLALAAGSATYGAIGEGAFVETQPVANGFTLVTKDRAAALHIDQQEFPGVLRIAGHLQADIERVTGVKPAIESGVPRAPAVVIGTIGQGGLVDRLVASGKLDVAAINGKWDAFLIETVEAPFPGVERALVVAGANKRGTIYGMYEISEQIGVSPWYWWADVPVKKREALYVKPGRVAEQVPVVQYRGIFINDEAPALTGWVQEKFGKFDHTFYQHVFELILRLRGNYLWPAMWQPRAFIDDDPENARLADEMGVVIGTTHHEPMMRAHAEWDRYGKGPWDYSKNPEVLREFWRGGVERVKDKEIIVSLGMRGDGDEPMSEGENVALLERVVADQRTILGDVLGKKQEEIPQLWALYKEVQGYYERGMRVPDDVILLWCDDNWGNIRRLPTPEEQKRSGGAGVYYHFDYVGGPRNYKWINTTPITKVWEQMNLAWQHDANRIWIVNVGDIKPMEFPIEFFLNMAWAPGRWNQDTLADFSRAWAAREFGVEHAAEAAALVDGYTKLNGRRKPEMLAPDTLSLVNYREADRVLGEWRDLTARAEKLYGEIAPEARDAFFQLVLYPVKASGVVHEIHVAAGKNRLYAVQGRAAANTEAQRVRELFALDQELVKQYHSLGGGRWNHQMSQSKMGYTYWQTPNLEVAPAVSEVHPLAEASMAMGIEGS